MATCSISDACVYSAYSLIRVYNIEYPVSWPVRYHPVTCDIAICTLATSMIFYTNSLNTTSGRTMYRISMQVEILLEILMVM